MTTTINVALADDETLFRKAMQLLLEHDMGIKVVFEASDGNELLEKLRGGKMHPDIILMDLMMPGLNGIETTKIVYGEFPDIKIIALSSHSSSSFISNMINIGAASYLVKNSRPLEVLQTINEVFRNGFYYNSRVLEVVRANMLPEKRKMKDGGEQELTTREIEVLRLICLQKTTREIADSLFISQRTVEGHRNNLILKTQSRNIAGLAIFALKNNLFEADFWL
ncbi:response regulator transcription factor [uncultured Flavobacterium sp.]|uniref:response regulator transcription factor n=1 Tax=uncultured Flavobacterium sp. TaxID=165435 RepID=UPI0025EEB760|nr:response regulator transcription factor [uncultured Flavobacterium sp.]